MNKYMVFGLVLIILIFTSSVVMADDFSITLEAKVGYAENRAPEGWLPISVIIKNDGNRQFEGDLKIQILNRSITNQSKRETIYSFPVTLPPHSSKILRTTVLYQRDFFAPFLFKLIKEKDIILEKEYSIDIIRDYKDSILVINQSQSGFNFLGKNRLVFYQKPEYLSENWLGYQQIDLVILDRANYSGLNEPQINALQKWVEMGNKIIITGNGSHSTYNSDLIKRIFPYNIYGKKSLKINGYAAEIWQIKNKQGDLLLKNDRLPRYILRRIGRGEIIFNALNYYHHDKKEDLLLKIISSNKNQPSFNYGVLDHLSGEMYEAIPYKFPIRILITALLIGYFLILGIIYKYFRSDRFNVFNFIGVFNLVVIIFSLFFFFTVGRNTLISNNVLSEISVIQIPSEVNGPVFVEGYYTYFSHSKRDNGYVLNKNDGFLTGAGLNSESQLGKVHRFDIYGDLIRVNKNKYWTHFKGFFRGCYLTKIPILFTNKYNNDSYFIKINNKSGYRVEQIHCLYQGEWYETGPILVDEKIVIDFEKMKGRENRKRDFIIGNNLSGYLTESIFDSLESQLTYKQNNISKYLLIMGLITGPTPDESVKLIKTGENYFAGFFYLLVPIKDQTGGEI